MCGGFAAACAPDARWRDRVASRAAHHLRRPRCPGRAVRSRPARASLGSSSGVRRAAGVVRRRARRAVARTAAHATRRGQHHDTGCSPRDAPASRYLFGMANGLLPCGLVYAALALPVALGSAPLGALAMVLFGLGTVPALATLAAGLARAAPAGTLAPPPAGGGHADRGTLVDRHARGMDRERECRARRRTPARERSP